MPKAQSMGSELNKNTMAVDDLQQAQEMDAGYRVVHRTVSAEEGEWRRGGELARVKLGDVEAALPAGITLDALKSFRVVAFVHGKWEDLPCHLDYCDGYGRWVGAWHCTPDTLLCFQTPRHTAPTQEPWPGSGDYEGMIPLSLWDPRERAWLEHLQLHYTTRPTTPLYPPRSPLSLVWNGSGYAVRYFGQTLLHFSADRNFQIDYACAHTTEHNLVPEGRTWRWLPTESTTEMGARAHDRVQFRPVVVDGPVLVVSVAGVSPAGRMAATLRIFMQRGVLVLEFCDYRVIRTRPELPPEEHPRCYAGQCASPYPNVHFAALMLEMDSRHAEVLDHLYKFNHIQADGPLAYVYTDERKQQGWNWLALRAGDAVAAISAHSRTHFPDHPFKAGRVARRTIIALEPFGSEVNGHYHSCDRYMLLLARDIDEVRETFDTLDTNPLLCAMPLAREMAFLDTYDCLRRWVNLNLDYLLRDGACRNALRTDGVFRDDLDTPLTPIAELIRLYEKTGWVRFREVAEQAATFAAQWILAGKFNTRGDGVGANGGGIYQNEQIYLLLALARVYRITQNPQLAEAIRAGVQSMQEMCGGVGTWGWNDFTWHAGGWGPDGQALFYWPVNTNQFATLCFRLYQLLGDRSYYEQAMEIMVEYRRRITPGSWEIVRGGGVSDTTRGVHLFAEALEVAGDDPRLDCAFLTSAVERTLERFWVEGWLQIRHSIYGELIHAGDTPGECFSPGFRHWHNCGSHLDILPRMQVAAELGVGEQLTRRAMRDFALDFDVRYGLEEHTHNTRFAMRDSDIEPACWLDCELLPTLFAVRRRGWMRDEEFRLLHYKIHRMVQRTFIALDEEHGGWANGYDSHNGCPIKYLAYWENRHSHEAFAKREPLEMWGFITRDAFYDHSTHYWHAFEQLVDELVTVEPAGMQGNTQLLRLLDDGLAANLPIPRPILTPQAPNADDVALTDPAWTITDRRTVTIGGQAFWLLAVYREDESE